MAPRMEQERQLLSPLLHPFGEGDDRRFLPRKPLLDCLNANLGMQVLGKLYVDSPAFCFWLRLKCSGLAHLVKWLQLLLSLRMRLQ